MVEKRILPNTDLIQDNYETNNTLAFRVLSSLCGTGKTTSRETCCVSPTGYTVHCW